MRALITGGGGFLGAWIAKRLLDGGHAIRILDRASDSRLVETIVGPAASAIEWRRGDVTRAEDVAEAAEGTDTIIHLAALLTPACQADPAYGATVNLIGTLNAFAAARRHGHSRLAYASSAGVFGRDCGSLPRPLTHYGAFKLACEGCARALWLDDRVASIGFRPLVIYGPGREVGSSAGISLACRAAARAEPFTIAFTGSTDLIYVEDVAAAFAAAATRPFEGAHVFNLCGERASVDQVVAEIRRLVPGADLAAAGEPLPITDTIERHDTEAVLGRLPHTPLADGLARTLAFYRRTETAP